MTQTRTGVSYERDRKRFSSIWPDPGPACGYSAGGEDKLETAVPSFHAVADISKATTSFALYHMKETDPVILMGDLIRLKFKRNRV